MEVVLEAFEGDESTSMAAADEQRKCQGGRNSFPSGARLAQCSTALLCPVFIPSPLTNDSNLAGAFKVFVKFEKLRQDL